MKKGSQPQTIGPGIYNEEATLVRTRTEAEGVILMVIKGAKGTGFSVQASPEIQAALPGLLHSIADTLEYELKTGRFWSD